MKPILYLVIPCYNEEEVLPVTAPLFEAKLEALAKAGRIGRESRILFVDDGSTDGTWRIIRRLCQEDGWVLGLSLSRNCGHQNALLAGLSEAERACDAAVTMDCDGQDDLNAIDAMLDEYEKGSEIVYGVRSRRDTDTFFKRTSAQLFYRIMRWLGADVIYNHADYRLVSARVLHEFANYREVNLFLRGLFPLVGFPSSCVYYERKERSAGKTHYPWRKMLALAADGITSLSIRPLRAITAIGFAAVLISLIGIVWAVVGNLSGETVSGWTSTICIICFMGGIQLLCLGVIGEYVGKIYMETKQRPRYIVRERTGDTTEKIEKTEK